jgi:hypothetical protein
MLRLVVGVVFILAVGGRRSAAKLAASIDAPAVRVAVPADGIHETPVGGLRVAGVDLAKADARGLSRPTGGAAPFEGISDGKQRVLRFYGQALGQEARTTRTSKTCVTLSRRRGSDFRAIHALAGAQTEKPRRH